MNNEIKVVQRIKDIIETDFKQYVDNNISSYLTPEQITQSHPLDIDAVYLYDIDNKDINFNNFILIDSSPAVENQTKVQHAVKTTVLILIYITETYHNLITQLKIRALRSLLRKFLLCRYQEILQGNTELELEEYDVIDNKDQDGVEREVKLTGLSVNFFSD